MARINKFLSDLRGLGDSLRVDEAARESVRTDWSGLEGCPPAALFLPKNRDEVVAAARSAADHGVVLVPRGAGTGKAGGAIPAADQVVVDLSRMKRIVSFEPANQFLRVEPGVLTGDLEAAAQAKGFMFAPDPQSRATCTIGGNVATNAGGPRALKYGVTGDNVWGVELVLVGGEVLRTGRECLKSVAGLDLTSLVVGSEGTLGIVTEVTARLLPAPSVVEGAWLRFESEALANAGAERVFGAGFRPSALELIDRAAMGIVAPDHGPVALHIEFDGSTGAVRQEIERACAVAAPTSFAIASDEGARETFRDLRRSVSAALKRIYPFKLSDDIAVPRSSMHLFLERAHAMARDAGVSIAAYGHLGDGNLHFNRLAKTLAERERAEALRDSVLELVLELRGTLSAEHGIGTTKRSALVREIGEGSLDLQRRIKRVFDPYDLMNRGKVF